MEKLKTQICEADNMRIVLSQIKEYAKDHTLTAEQIKDIFSEGIVASVRNGTLQLPIYSESMLQALENGY